MTGDKIEDPRLNRLREEVEARAQHLSTLASKLEAALSSAPFASPEIADLIKAEAEAAIRFAKALEEHHTYFRLISLKSGGHRDKG